MPWFIIALKQLFPRAFLSSFFACVSQGIALAGRLLIVQSVMSGFYYEIRKGINEASGDIRIEGNRILYAEGLLENARELPGVAGVAPTYMGW